MAISDIIDELKKPGVSEWSGVMTSWRKQQPIDKQEVLELLRSGVPVPAYAAEFLADALDDEEGRALLEIFQRAKTARDRVYGRSPNDLQDLLGAIRSCTVEEVQTVARKLIDPDHRYELTVGPSKES